MHTVYLLASSGQPMSTITLYCSGDIWETPRAYINIFIEHKWWKKERKLPIWITKKQSEPTDLRQGYVVRQVAAPYSVWQRFSLCPIENNVNENFKVIQNLGFLPDHPQNWITGSFCHSRHSQKISERSVHNFLSYLADTQTDRQTNKVWQKHNLPCEGNKIYTNRTIWQSEQANPII